MPKWTDAENNLLSKVYPIYDNPDELLEHFPGRGYDAIRYHARSLGIKRPRRKNAWSQNEISILIENYASLSIDELLELLPRRTINSIYQRAFHLRLSKPKPKPKPKLKLEPKLEPGPGLELELKPESKPESEQEPEENPKAAQKRQVIPVKPIKFKPWEKQVLCDLGSRVSLIELKMLIPRRSNKELYRMAEVFGVELESVE